MALGLKAGGARRAGAIFLLVAIKRYPDSLIRHLISPKPMFRPRLSLPNEMARRLSSRGRTIAADQENCPRDWPVF